MTAAMALFTKGFLIAYLSTLTIGFGLGKLVDKHFENEETEE